MNVDAMTWIVVILVQVALTLLMFGQRKSKIPSDYFTLQADIKKKDIRIKELEGKLISEMRNYQSIISRLMTKIKRYENQS